MTITKTINLYRLDELSEKVQKKVIEQFRNEGTFVNEDLVLDLMKERLDELLKENNIEPVGKLGIYYSLSYCQGDGAMFYGVVNWEGLGVNIRHRGRYYHEYSRVFDFYGADITLGKEKVFEEIYVKICKAVRDYGYDLINDERSDEFIRENIMANDYWFRDDGSIEYDI